MHGVTMKFNLNPFIVYGSATSRQA